MKKILAKYILLVFFALNINIVFYAGLYFVGLPRTAHITYVKNIIGSPKDVVRIRKALEYFNSLSDTKDIVRFTHPGSLVAREITITAREPIEINEIGLAGLTYPRFLSPEILIFPSENDRDFMETVIHEYLHVFAYDHTDNICDIMYRSTSFCISDENIKEYAMKLQ